MTGQRYKN